MSSDQTTEVSRRVSQSELARELDVSRQAVSDLVKRGVLTVGEDKKLCLDTARAALRDRVRPTAKTAAAVGVPPAAPSTVQGAAPASDSAAGYYVAKAEREASEASMATLRLRKMQGDLIERDATVQAVFNAFRLLRNQLTFLPRKLSGQLLGKTSPREVQQIIEAEIRASLDQFQQKALARLATDIGSEGATDAEGAE